MFKNLFPPLKFFQPKKKRNSNTFQEKETIYHSMIEHSVLGMCIIQDNHFLHVNNKWCEIFGYSYEEAVNKINPFETVHDDYKETVSQNIEKLHSGHTNSLDFEFIAIRKNNETFWIRIYVKVIMYQGKPSVYGIYTDITKQKESAMLINEARLHVTLETTQIGIWDWNLEEDTWYASPIYYTMLGYEPITGNSDRKVWLNRIHPDERELVRRKINLMRTRKEEHYSYEARILHADGSYRWHQVIGHIIDKGKQGEIKRMVGIRKDITAFKKAEEELRKSKRRLRTLLDTVPDLIWLKDPEGFYLQCNQRFEQLNGVPEKQIIGKTDYDFVSKEQADFFRQKDKEATQSGKSLMYETEVTFADGHNEILETIKTPTFENDGTLIGVLGIGRIITEKKKNEQELKKYRENLERLVKERTEELEATIKELYTTNKELIIQKEELLSTVNKLNSTRKQLIQSEKMASLGILSSGIAHEINNPLNFIHGGSIAIEQYFNSKLKDEHTEVAPFLEAINEGIKRASQIVSSLGHYSRSEDLPVIECDIHTIIDNCLIMLQNRLKSKVIITKHYTPKKHVLLGNEGKLHQAILNVIVNAEQAIKDNGTIEIKTDVIDDQFTITIQDSGKGMKQETINKIFDPFFTTKITGEGTGLGLYITYDIIQEHQGKIMYESEINKGTKVIIQLPVNK